LAESSLDCETFGFVFDLVDFFPFEDCFFDVPLRALLFFVTYLEEEAPLALVYGGPL